MKPLPRLVYLYLSGQDLLIDERNILRKHRLTKDELLAIEVEPLVMLLC